MEKYIFCGKPVKGSEFEAMLERDAIHIKDENDGDHDMWLSFDYWLHPDPIGRNYKEQKLPDELIELVDKWKAQATITLKDFEADWYEKNATLKFLWWNRFYVISGNALNLNSEQFGAFSLDIERDLDAHGCRFHRYTGMID